MLGCVPDAIAGRYFDVIAEARDVILKRRGTAELLLRKYDIELRQLYLDLREMILEPEAPAMQNTDGDPLQMMRMDFALGCAAQEALEALLVEFEGRESVPGVLGPDVAGLRRELGLGRKP